MDIRASRSKGPVKLFFAVIGRFAILLGLVAITVAYLCTKVDAIAHPTDIAAYAFGGVAVLCGVVVLFAAT